MQLDELIDPTAALSQLGSGYEFTEGPVWVAAENCMLFNDIPGDTRWRWTADRGMELVERPTFKGNGMCLDNGGHLIICEHVSSSVTRIRNGVREIVAFHYQGKYLNSPNDVVTRGADGSIYFTDPSGGRKNDWIGQERNRDLDFQGVFRIPPGGGDIELLVPEDEFDLPNGLCFSPDESVLYINDSTRKNLKRFDVSPDGSVANGRIILEGVGSGVAGEGNLDGMECDELGNVWVTGPGGVWVLTPDGEQIGTVEVPEVVGSLCWGGDDMRTLFLMSSTTVHSIRTRVAAAKLPPF